MADPIGMVVPPMRALQMIAMLALGPMPGDLEDHCRTALRDQAGLDDGAIDDLVGQARAIMEGKAPPMTDRPLTLTQRDAMRDLARDGERRLGCTHPTMRALLKRGLVKRRPDIVSGYRLWSLSDAGAAALQAKAPQ